MDQNRDWKLIVALALAGLALFVALGGPRGRGDGYVSAPPQQIIVQPVAPTGGTTAPVVTVPGTYTGVSHAWGGHGGWGGGFSIFPLLFFGGLVFLAFWVFGRNRHRWGGPGGYGRPWGGPGPGPQGPPQAQQYAQYPPQYAPTQGQYPPSVGHAQGEQPQQGQPTQGMDAHGDITRPERSGEY